MIFLSRNQQWQSTGWVVMYSDVV